MDENTPTTEPGGLNRRDMLRRSALVGGALIWTAPAVQTLAAPAFAAGSTTPGDQCDGHSGSISYVVALIKCGNSYYLVKYSATGEAAMACGTSVSVSSDDTFCTTGLDALKAKAGTALLGTCPPGVSGGTNCSTTNQLTCDLEIVLPVGCSLEGYVLHDGNIQTSGDGHKCVYNSGGGIQTNGGNTTGFTFPNVSSTGTVCFDKA